MHTRNIFQFNINIFKPVEREKDVEKNLGPVNENSEYRRQLNHKLYTHVEKITHTILEKPVVFYGLLTRMSLAILSNRIFMYFLGKKTKVSGR